MGKLKKGILGGFSGKVGNLIGQNWKGIDVLRTMPESVANPKTSAQMEQRNKFSACVADARELLPDLIKTYWDPFARKMSGYNHFIQQNIDQYASTHLDSPGYFKASLGILTGVSGFSISEAPAAPDIGIDFDDNTGKGDALATDELVVVIYNETQDIWEVFETSENRDSLGVTVILDHTANSSDILHGWGFWARPDLSKISDSSYATLTVS